MRLVAAAALHFPDCRDAGGHEPTGIAHRIRDDIRFGEFAANAARRGAPAWLTQVKRYPAPMR
jgi:hypothetical protein